MFITFFILNILASTHYLSLKMLNNNFIFFTMKCQRNADLVEKDMVSLSRDINTICAEIQEREKKNLIRRVFSSNKVG